MIEFAVCDVCDTTIDLSRFNSNGFVRIETPTASGFTLTYRHVGCERFRGALEELHDVEQILGEVLGYPWYSDDQQSFPGTTKADGVCVGDHTAASLAMEAAERIRRSS